MYSLLRVTTFSCFWVGIVNLLRWRCLHLRRLPTPLKEEHVIIIIIIRVEQKSVWRQLVLTNVHRNLDVFACLRPSPWWSLYLYFYWTQKGVVGWAIEQCPKQFSHLISFLSGSLTSPHLSSFRVPLQHFVILVQTTERLLQASRLLPLLWERQLLIPWCA
jgi:hypothetical protein